ncbi:uncharacterized protein LOC113147018 [Cyclospora cayetanensis]|uniref:Uncharacterized protein LOC113147018 n=1 Tax=Cyclospora cayetanensis TaxID=88456 RepID=A0A6P6RVJ0_9EIME|nr:uncharacterized protein LOC113147018 [Cyclospora cayetanensis]
MQVHTCGATAADSSAFAAAPSGDDVLAKEWQQEEDQTLQNSSSAAARCAVLTVLHLLRLWALRQTAAKPFAAVAVAAARVAASSCLLLPETLTGKLQTVLHGLSVLYTERFAAVAAPPAVVEGAAQQQDHVDPHAAQLVLWQRRVGSVLLLPLLLQHKVLPELPQQELDVLRYHSTSFRSCSHLLLDRTPITQQQQERTPTKRHQQPQLQQQQQQQQEQPAVPRFFGSSILLSFNYIAGTNSNLRLRLAALSGLRQLLRPLLQLLAAIRRERAALQQKRHLQKHDASPLVTPKELEKALATVADVLEALLLQWAAMLIQSLTLCATLEQPQCLCSCLSNLSSKGDVQHALTSMRPLCDALLLQLAAAVGVEPLQEPLMQRLQALLHDSGQLLQYVAQPEAAAAAIQARASAQMLEADAILWLLLQLVAHHDARPHVIPPVLEQAASQLLLQPSCCQVHQQQREEQQRRPQQQICAECGVTPFAASSWGTRASFAGALVAFLAAARQPAAAAGASPAEADRPFRYLQLVAGWTAALGKPPLGLVLFRRMSFAVLQLLLSVEMHLQHHAAAVDRICADAAAMARAATAAATVLKAGTSVLSSQLQELPQLTPAAAVMPPSCCLLSVMRTSFSSVAQLFRLQQVLKVRLIQRQHMTDTPSGCSHEMPDLATVTTAGEDLVASCKRYLSQDFFAALTNSPPTAPRDAVRAAAAAAALPPVGLSVHLTAKQKAVAVRQFLLVAAFSSSIASQLQQRQLDSGVQQQQQHQQPQQQQHEAPLPPRDVLSLRGFAVVLQEKAQTLQNLLLHSPDASPGNKNSSSSNDVSALVLGILEECGAAICATAPLSRYHVQEARDLLIQLLMLLSPLCSCYQPKQRSRQEAHSHVSSCSSSSSNTAEGSNDSGNGGGSCANGRECGLLQLQTHKWISRVLLPLVCCLSTSQQHSEEALAVVLQLLLLLLQHALASCPFIASQEAASERRRPSKRVQGVASGGVVSMKKGSSSSRGSSGSTALPTASAAVTAIQATCIGGNPSVSAAVLKLLSKQHQLLVALFQCLSTCLRLPLPCLFLLRQQQSQMLLQQLLLLTLQYILPAAIRLAKHEDSSAAGVPADASAGKNSAWSHALLQAALQFVLSLSRVSRGELGVRGSGNAPAAAKAATVGTATAEELPNPHASERSAEECESLYHAFQRVLRYCAAAATRLLQKQCEYSLTLLLETYALQQLGFWMPAPCSGFAAVAAADDGSVLTAAALEAASGATQQTAVKEELGDLAAPLQQKLQPQLQHLQQQELWKQLGQRAHQKATCTELLLHWAAALLWGDGGFCRSSSISSCSGQILAMQAALQQQQHLSIITYGKSSKELQAPMHAGAAAAWRSAEKVCWQLLGTLLLPAAATGGELPSVLGLDTNILPPCGADTPVSSSSSTTGKNLRNGCKSEAASMAPIAAVPSLEVSDSWKIIATLHMFLGVSLPAGATAVAAAVCGSSCSRRCTGNLAAPQDAADVKASSSSSSSSSSSFCVCCGVQLVGGSCCRRLRRGVGPPLCPWISVFRHSESVSQQQEQQQQQQQQQPICCCCAGVVWYARLLVRTAAAYPSAIGCLSSSSSARGVHTPLGPYWVGHNYSSSSAATQQEPSAVAALHAPPLLLLHPFQELLGLACYEQQASLLQQQQQQQQPSAVAQQQQQQQQQQQLQQTASLQFFQQQMPLQLQVLPTAALPPIILAAEEVAQQLHFVVTEQLRLLLRQGPLLLALLRTRVAASDLLRLAAALQQHDWIEQQAVYYCDDTAAAAALSHKQRLLLQLEMARQKGDSLQLLEFLAPPTPVTVALPSPSGSRAVPRLGGAAAAAAEAAAAAAGATGESAVETPSKLRPGLAGNIAAQRTRCKTTRRSVRPSHS